MEEVGSNLIAAYGLGADNDVDLCVVLACIIGTIQLVPHRLLLGQSLERHVRTQLSSVLLLIESLQAAGEK